MVDGASCRAFALRDWDGFGAAKERWWVEEKRRTGVPGAVKAASALLAQARAARPDWPSEVERRADRDMHLRLRDAIRLAPCRAG